MPDARSDLNTIETVLEHLRLGRPVIVADDESRENEGDVILSGELASQEWMAWLVRMSSGLVCAPVSGEIADRLDLPPMVEHNEDERGTAYTVTVDSARGVTTGISAHDRAHTLNVLADPASVRDDLHRPGHILPLRAVEGGVRARSGHTEAAVDLMLAAGLRPVAAISEIVAPDGEMMRMPGLLDLGEREGVPVVTIGAFIEWLNDRDAAAASPAGAPSGSVASPTTVPASGVPAAEGVTA